MLRRSPPLQAGIQAGLWRRRRAFRSSQQANVPGYPRASNGVDSGVGRCARGGRARPGPGGYRRGRCPPGCASRAPRCGPGSPSRSSASIALPDSASRWAVGSSSRITSAPVRRVRATARRWRSPPLRKAPPGPIRVSRPCSSRASTIRARRRRAPRACCRGSPAGAASVLLRPRGVAVRPRQQEVAADGRVEQVRLLRAPGRAPAQQSWPPAGRQEPQNRGEQGRFAGPRGAGDGEPAPGPAAAVSPVKTLPPPGHATARSPDSIPAPAPGKLPPRAPGRRSGAGTCSGLRVRRGIQDPGFTDAPQHRAQRRVLPHRRRDGRVGFHERELDENDDGDRGRLRPRR